MTRPQTWKQLADWIEGMRDRFNLRTIDDLLGKIKELQKQSTQGIEGHIVKSSKKDRAKLTPSGVHSYGSETLEEGARMPTLGHALLWLLDSVMLFAYPTAKQTWENRALVILLLALVVVAVLAKSHHAP